MEWGQENAGQRSGLICCEQVANEVNVEEVRSGIVRCAIKNRIVVVETGADHD